MSLVPDYDSSESSSDSDEEEDVSSPVQTLQSASVKLPTPNFDGEITKVESKGSVFSNPFLEEEAAKEAILQKHVKMVDTKSNVVVINGKRICWNYRKGKCRFGHNCKFAHDSDVQKTEQELQMEKEAAKARSVVCQGTHLSQTNSIPQSSCPDSEPIEEESTLNRKKRKRPGLSQGLVPGKKVLKSYMKNKI